MKQLNIQNVKENKIALCVLLMFLTLFGFVIIRSVFAYDCKNQYLIQKTKFDTARTSQNYSEVYLALIPHEQECLNKKSKEFINIKYTYLTIQSAYFGDHEKEALDISSTANKWIEKNISKDQNVSAVSDELADIYDLSTKSLPTSFSTRVQQLGNSKSDE